MAPWTFRILGRRDRPGRLSAADVLDDFHELWKSLSGPNRPGIVDVVVPTDGPSVQPDALCAIARGLMRAQQLGLSVNFSGDLNNANRLANYLSRANLFGMFGQQPPGLPPPEMDRVGLHLPMREVSTQDDVYDAVNGLVEMLLHQAPCSAGIVEGFEWAINEVIDNVFVHAESPVGAIVVGQTVTNRHCVRVAIGDLGTGVLASLRQGYPSLRNEREAIFKATERGITRDTSVGQGNGLAGTRQIIEENGGTMVITSSNWTVQFGASGVPPKDWSEWAFPGTQVVITLRTDRRLDLGQTLVGERTSHYLEKMYENDTGEKVIRVSQHCRSCGNRPAGAIMRTLLRNVSGTHVDGVLIDFTGIRSISSSFADEFVGKFAAEVGVNTIIVPLSSLPSFADPFRSPTAIAS